MRSCQTKSGTITHVQLNPALLPPLGLLQSCGGLVKPDIVFFGESLPERFWER